MGSSSSPKIPVGHVTLTAVNSTTSSPLFVYPDSVFKTSTDNPVWQYSCLPTTQSLRLPLQLQCASAAPTLQPSKTLELLPACCSINLLKFQCDSKTHLLKFPRLLQGGSFLCYRKGRENRMLLLLHFSKKNYITAQPQFLISYATA